MKGERGEWWREGVFLSRSGGAEPVPNDLQLTEKEHFAQKCSDLKNMFCQLLT